MIRAMLYDRPNPAVFPTTIGSVAIPDVIDGWSDCNVQYGSPGGFKQATLVLQKDRNETWRFLMDYLGYHVEIYDDTTETLFEGLLWDIRANWGGRFERRMTLEGLANRCTVNYSLIGTDGVDRDSPEPSATQTHAPSVNRHGIIEIEEQQSARNVAEVLNLCTKMIYERCWPDLGPLGLDIPGGAGHPALTITVMGYWRTLRYRIYRRTATGVATVNTILSDIITGADQPAPGEYYSQFLSNSTARINGTGLGGVDRANDEGLTVEDHICDLVNLGGPAPNYDRYSVGVWEGRVLWVWPSPYSSQYGFAADPDYWIDQGRAYTSAGNEIRPYKIRPGKVIQVQGQDSVYDRPGQGTAGFSKFCVGDTSFSARDRRTTLKGVYGSRGLEEQIAQINLLE